MGNGRLCKLIFQTDCLLRGFLSIHTNWNSRRPRIIRWDWVKLKCSTSYLSILIIILDRWLEVNWTVPKIPWLNSTPWWSIKCLACFTLSTLFHFHLWSGFHGEEVVCYYCHWGACSLLGINKTERKVDCYSS